MTKAPGQNWLLLRGLSREPAHWGGFVPLMQRAFPEAQIHTLDLPGTGRLYRQRSPATIAAIVENLRQQVLEVGLLQQPVTILALSLGAMAAWEWLLRYPNEINGAVLINTSFGDISPFYRRLRWQSYAKLLRLTLYRDIQRRELEILRLVCNCLENEAAIAQNWAQIQRQRPVSSRNSLRQIIAAARYRTADNVPQSPVLILNGQGDRLVDAACSEAIRQKWRLPLRSHPWAGHDLPLDDGDWVIAKIQEWISDMQR